jgi:proline iminopeptidase
MLRIIILVLFQFPPAIGWIHRKPNFGRHSIAAGLSLAQSEQTQAAKGTDLRELYPPSVAFQNGTIQVDEIHCLSYEIYGKQDETSGKPPVALFLHGGPGAGCFPTHARFFDPDRYQIVLLDQRGSGKSQPRGEVRNNTLGHLVEDCETLRQTLGIKRWDVVLGGSWGTTLAIAYAQSFPESVRALILRGVCLLRTSEVDWLFSSNGGAAKQNTQAWTAFEQAVGIDSESSIQNPRSALHAYYDRLMGSDNEVRWNAVRSWMKWEFFMSVSHKLPASINISDSNATMKAMNAWNHTVSPVAVRTSDNGWSYQDAWGAKIPDEEQQRLGIQSQFSSIEAFRQGLLPAPTSPEVQDFPLGFSVSESAETCNSSNVPAQNMLTCFYSTNDKFCMNNLNLLSPERIQRIQNIPCIAVQGGQDRICPPDTALDLCEAWPEMELRMPIVSGHSMYDPFITHELIRATDRLADTFE